MKITEIAKSNNISIMLYNDYYFNFDCPVSREGKLLIPISVITRCNVVINNTTNEIIKNRYPICSSEFFNALYNLRNAEYISFSDICHVPLNL